MDLTSPPLSYAALRWRWCLAALRVFLRRWGVYAVVLAAAVGAGASSGLAAIGGLAAWTVLPLWRALSQDADPAWGALAWLAQAGAGALLLRGMRPILWPGAWADTERALPLRRRDLLGSDVQVCLSALLPWAAFQAFGAATVLGQSPAWLSSRRSLAVTALCCAQGVAVLAAVVGLQRARRLRSGSLGRGAPAVPGWGSAGSAAGPVPRLSWVVALLLLPLWRGPATRLGRASLLAGGGLVMPAAGLAWWPDAAAAWMAAWSALALVAVTRLNTLSRQDLAPLLASAAETLPIDRARLERACRGLVGLPALAGAVALMAALALALPAGTLRPAVLAAWCGVQVAVQWRATGVGPAKPQEASAAWLLALVVGVALASEVTR